MNLKNKKTKFKQAERRANFTLKGLSIEWVDTDPLRDEGNPNIKPKYSHRNHVLRLQAKALWQGLGAAITQETPLLWEVTTTCVFRYANGMEQQETSTTKAHSILTELDSVVLDEIRRDIRHGENLHHVHFFIECLGLYAPPVSDEERIINALERQLINT